MKAIMIDGVHEYNLEIKDRVITLYYTNSEQWSTYFRNKVVLSLIDTGNGYKIQTSLRKKNNIDYDEALYLLIILSELNDCKIETYIKEKEI